MARSRPVAITRLVSMINYISRHPGVSVEQLAEHFGRTPRQVRSDVELLDQAGIDDLLPGRTLEIDWDLYEDEDRVELFTSLEVNSPIALTGEEVARIILGLQMIAPSLSEGERNELPSTISTLLAASSQSPPIGDGVQTVVPLVDSAHFAQVLDAIESEGCLSIDYTNAEGVSSSRDVWPTGLVAERDGWVMSAWCSTRGEARSFRLDRVTSLKACEGEPHRPPRGRSQKTDVDLGENVEVTLSRDAEWVLGESVAKQAKRTRNSIVATFEVWDPSWLAAELLALAPYVEQTKPEEHLVQARNFAREALDIWNQIPPPGGTKKDEHE